MPDISTSYGPGQSTTATMGSGAGSGFPAGLDDLLLQVLRKRAAASAPAPAPVMMRAPMPMQREPVMQQEPAAKSDLERAKERDELLQIQARQQPPPMRMVTGPGITPGYVMDVNAMNAYQRAAYLPSNSTVAYGPQDAARAKAGLDDEATFQAGLAEDRARTKGQYGSDLGYAPGAAPASIQQARMAVDAGRRRAVQNMNNAYYGRFS